MKNILFLITVLLVSVGFAQTGSQEYNQLTGADLNEVTQKIDAFAGRKMRLTKNGDQQFTHNSKTEVLVTQNFQKFNEPDKQLTITYSTSPKENRLYIQDISITGDQDLLIDFYVKFWDTTITIETNDNEILASSKYLNDEVNLYTKDHPKILITEAK